MSQVSGPATGGRPKEVRLRLVPKATSAATDIRIGDGILEGFAALAAGALPRATRWLYVLDEGVAPRSVQARWRCGAVGGEDALVVPAGERSKTREVHASIEDAILERSLTRDDAVVAVGGGAVLDAAGFAAATARRGIPWIAVPTSVVAISDASIGGKTAIDHPRGKNLLGAFHPPRLVVADVRTLVTLPARDFTSGLAEVYKVGVVGDPSIVETLRAGPPALNHTLVELFARAVRVKVGLVESDERDEGVRRSLNYGHTVGHALETILGPDAMRHGEAVAIGMGVAAEIARSRGIADRAFVERQDVDLAALALPIRLPRTVDLARVRVLVLDDKKKRAGTTHTMALPCSSGGVEIVEDVTTAEIDAALDARSASR